MEKFRLYNGEYVDKKYFKDSLYELLQEDWVLKPITELNWEHVNCLLSFETISKDNTNAYYESNNNNIISVRAYNEYIKPNKK